MIKEEWQINEFTKIVVGAVFPPDSFNSSEDLQSNVFTAIDRNEKGFSIESNYRKDLSIEELKRLNIYDFDDFIKSIKKVVSNKTCLILQKKVKPIEPPKDIADLFKEDEVEIINDVQGFFPIVKHLKAVYKERVLDEHEEKELLEKFYKDDAPRADKLRAMTEIKLNKNYIEHAFKRGIKEEVTEELREFLKTFKQKEDLDLLNYAQSLIEKDPIFKHKDIEKDLIKTINNRKMVIGLSDVKPIEIKQNTTKNNQLKAKEENEKNNMRGLKR